MALRRMMPRNEGRVINVCSAVAFHGVPLLASYCGAKHAVQGFGQSLQAELAQERSRVRLTTVFPPAVNTPFFDHATSHMGRPGRPLPPVYQPDVVAEAIHLAALTGCSRMVVSFTSVLFSIGARLAPVLVRQAIRRLGYERQLAGDAASIARHQPTLFEASDRASPSRGAFGGEARSSSWQVRLLALGAWVAGARPQGAGLPPPRQRRPSTQSRRARPRGSEAWASGISVLIVASTMARVTWSMRSANAASDARGLGVTATRSLT